MLSSEHPAIAALTAVDLEAVLLPPDRVGVPSSWWGHVPFAHLLIHELRPGLLVELGTYDGVSFSAFCNAIRRGGLATRCYAINSSRHDEYAGMVNENILSDTLAFVRQNYSAFATLLESSTSSALELFADGSIDLLHFDGIRSYEKSKKEYETWLPKLSERSVVLFHNTTIYEHSGIWRFWKEISQAYPSFEFHHSCGLGILAPRGFVPELIAALMKMESAASATLRRRFSELGERWISADDRARAFAAADASMQAKERIATENSKLLHELRIQTEATDAARQDVTTLLEEISLERAQHASVSQQLTSVTQQLQAMRLRLEQVRTSTSWRVMGPYRIFGRLVQQRLVVPLVATSMQRQRMRDFKRISRSKAFDASFYLGRESPPEDDDDVIMDYLAASQNAMPRGQQHPGAPQRRPTLGFHPLAYSAQCKSYDETTGEDPLAHYLRTGMPDGPWKHYVIQAHQPVLPSSNEPRILIHAHFHYPDLLEGLLQRLSRNASKADLFITTTSEAKAADIELILESQNQKAKTLVVPNRGRDIGPLLMHFDEFKGYDIVGHLHGKRSLHSSQGDNWRAFLWDHLIGGATPMIDVIVEAFSADEQLGLILPEDPNLNHWDMNHSLAVALADRMELRHALPPHFEFPKGTMFWARPAALRPIVDLGWDWDDFPSEPVVSDGSILHTLERLIPSAVEHAGFTFKAVHVPRSWRMPQ